MKDYMISMFIDNELDIDEKIEFVEEIHGSEAFKDETVELLRQEKLLRGGIIEYSSELRQRFRQSPFSVGRRPWIITSAFAAAAVIAILFFMPFFHTSSDRFFLYRFVLYRPDVKEVQIAGTFTEWKGVPMQKVGESGYWEIAFELPEGEYRFSYILEGRQKLADPTILAREGDDFGGENSVLRLEV